MNRMNKFLGATALTAVMALAAASPAYAAYSSQFNVQQSGFTDTYAPIGVTGDSLLTATSVTFTDQTQQLSNPAFTGALYSNGALMTWSVHTFNLNGAGAITWPGSFDVTWSAGGNNFDFTATAGGYTVTSTGASDFINITFTGTVVSTTDPINFPTQLALLGETGVDLGNGMAVNGRFVTPVAEPISMTIIGAGLAGLAAVRRRRRSV